jgi:hypothetical protein
MSIGTKKHDALRALGYNNFIVSDEGEVTLFDGQVLDEAALDAKMIELQKYDYKTKRARKYPKIQEQLDDLWHMMDQEIIPGKNSIWYNKILEIKNEYPKPE